MGKRVQPTIFMIVMLCYTVITANVSQFNRKQLFFLTYEFQRFYEILPKYLTCKQIDFEIVVNFSCTFTYVNRTVRLRTLELELRPGIELTNFHVWSTHSFILPVNFYKILSGKSQTNAQSWRKFSSISFRC